MPSGGVGYSVPEVVEHHQGAVTQAAHHHVVVVALLNVAITYEFLGLWWAHFFLLIMYVFTQDTLLVALLLVPKSR